MGKSINLDGLVNNEVYDYVVTNTLPQYMKHKGITYIVDFENMFLDQNRRVRGGFDNDVFIDSLKPIVVFDEGQYRWKHLTLYEIKYLNSIN